MQVDARSRLMCAAKVAAAVGWRVSGAVGSVQSSSTQEEPRVGMSVMKHVPMPRPSETIRSPPLSAVAGLAFKMPYRIWLMLSVACQ